MTRDDFQSYLNLSNNMATMGTHWPLNEVRSVETLAERFGADGYFGESSGRVLITDHSDRMLGVIVYFKPVHFWEALEIGYRIFLQEDQGKGFAKEAVALFSAFLFESRHISRLQITADPSNLPANALAKACGYTFEGCIRQASFCRGRMRDQNMWSLLPDESQSLETLISYSNTGQI